MRDLHISRRELLLHLRRVLLLGFQLMLVMVANRLAFTLRFDSDVPGWALAAFWQMLPWLVAIRSLTFFPFRLYEGLWRYTSFYDLKALIGGIAVSTVAFYTVANSPIGPETYPRSIYIIDATLLLLMLGGARMARRVFVEYAAIRPGKRVLMFGAGDAAERIVRDMKATRDTPYQPIGFVDDDPAKVGRRMHGIPVLGTRKDVPWILRQYRPDEVLIAIPSATASVVRDIVRVFAPFKVPIKTLPNLQDIIGGKIEVAQIRSLSLEDLLPRSPVGLDAEPVKRLIAGRRIMVTGAGGSIGSELCRQIARLKPASLVMFERYENSLHEIWLELNDGRPSFDMYAIVGDVTDETRVGDVLLTYRPEIIFHAAAHKHVPLMQDNPCEAIKNNVRGTRVIAAASERCGVERFIMISTDKAVNPTSVMGASKQLAELLIQLHAEKSCTAFSIVRFGNVLGSNGSVVPRFMDQIKKGGPVTVTHPEMRRFFMLIPEAVQLVMHAASHAERGSTYVLDMGHQVKLVDMAYDMIRLSGFASNEIKVEFTGLRPGEKLSEELVGADEEVSPGKVDKIQCVRRRYPPPADLPDRVADIEKEAARGNSGAVVAMLIELTGLSVPQQSRNAVPPPPRIPAANVLVHHASTHTRNAALPRSSRRGHIR